MVFLHITKERITQEYDMDSGTLAIPIDSIGETKLDATSGTLQVIEATFKCTNICMLDALKGQYVFFGRVRLPSPAPYISTRHTAFALAADGHRTFT